MPTAAAATQSRFDLRSWRRHWFVLAAVPALLLGVFWPEPGVWIRGTGLVFPLLVATTLFITGFTLDTRRVLRRMTGLKVLLAGLLTTYVAAPLAAWFLAHLWGPAATGPDSDGFFFLQAMMIAAAQAGTLATAIVLTGMADGDQELALVLTFTTNLLSAILTPLVLRLSVGTVVAMPVGDMMVRMFLVAVLPVVLGQVARRGWRSPPPRLVDAVRLIPQLNVLIFVYCGFGAVGARLSVDPKLVLLFVGASASLHALMLAWSWAAATLMHLSPGARAAFIFCGSQKTLPNGIYLWDQFFAANPFGAVPLVLYHLMQLVVGALLVGWVRVAPATAAGEARRH